MGLLKEKNYANGKGTYGSQKGRPSKNQMLSGKQKNLPEALKKKIMASKMKKKKNGSK
tara:strand:+ start:476 stop:649 length:174 start_codon:yes stop_codon:yes gene_type:complete